MKSSVSGHFSITAVNVCILIIHEHCLSIVYNRMVELISLYHTKRVVRWLQTTERPRIHQIFDHVINLVNENGQMLSLVAQNIGRGPFSLVVPEIERCSLSLEAKVSIDNANQILRLGDYKVHLAHSQLWDARPDWSRLRGRWEWRESGHLSAEFQTHLHTLVNAIKTNVFAQGEAEIRWLAGRGTGATPTGDDILMGVLYGLYVIEPESEWIEIIGRIVPPLTTTLSANYLRAAVAGEAIEAWHDVIANKPNAIEHLWTIGHTSGRDAWAGFVTTGKMLRDSSS